MMKTDDIVREFNSKYGFILYLVHRNNTDNLPENLYRVRLVDKSEKINRIEQLSYPKSGRISLGRCNLANEPVFYCSDKSTTVMAEILKCQDPTDKDVYLSVWKFKPGVNVNIFPLLDKARQKGLKFKTNPLKIIPNIERRTAVKSQLQDIEKYFYDKDDYFKSASVSNLLFQNDILPCDCIFYPSAIEKETGINISVKTDYFDENFEFQRAYKFEFSGFTKNYKVFPLKYTLSKTDELVWAEVDYSQLLLRTLLETDMNLHKS